MAKDPKIDPAKPAPPPLDSEVASQAIDPFSTVFMGVLRSNDPLIMERGLAGSEAHELYRDLRRDGKVFAGLQKRKLAVVSRGWTVEPVTQSEQGAKDAAVVNDILATFGFDRICSGLMDALLVGWQPAEVIWTLGEVSVDGSPRQMVVPARVVKRSHRRFVYVQDEGQAPELRLLTRGDMQRGMPVPERKFIVHRLEAEDDNPYGTGLGLQLYWPVFFKRKGVLAWTKFLDRFGLPIPWGKYPREASPREKGTLFDALRAVSNDGTLMTPEGTMIELLESKINGSATPHQAHVEFMDDWIMEVILGQAPRGGNGGALAAAATEREGVRLELSQADSDLLSETLNSTLIQWICEYNGLQPCLVYRKIEKDEDRQAESQTDKNISELGFQMTEEGVKAKYGDHWERKAAAPVPSALPGGGDPASFAEGDAAEPDAIDRLIAAELADWQPLMAPLVEPVRALLASAAREGLTAQELIDRLPQVLAEMDADPLAQALTRTAFAARLGTSSGLEIK